MATLTADQILKSKDFNIKEIDVPEWGGSICIRSMNGEHYRAVMDLNDAHTRGEATITDFMYAVLVFTICDDDGKLLFSDGSQLHDKSLPVVTTIFEHAMEVNGLEAAEKN